MKKESLFFIIITLMVFNLFDSKIFAYTEEFTLLLETMEIPKENILGKAVNEEIYNEYKLLVYGSPLDNHNGQRWKDVIDGKWSKNAGVWNGTGIRGEYWILGTNYNGKEVHNHLFPVDIEPPTQPTEWRYAIIPDALESWQETEKYMDDTQKEYMLTQKLMRNNTTYNLTVRDIGFEKVRIENYATWKTKGTVYTQRYDMNNKKWAANFMIPPMAGDAKLEGYAEFPMGTEFEISAEDSNLTIPIKYGSTVINLTDYAKAEHVKEIKSQLYINGECIEQISNTQALAVNKETFFNFNKNEYQEDSLIVLNIEIKSTLFTTFITDGALVDVKNYTIYIKYGEVEEEIETSFNNVSDEYHIEVIDLPEPTITDIKINRVVDGKIKPLLISKETGKEFICAGQTLYIEVKAINTPWMITLEFEGDTSISTFDKLTEQFEWIEPKNRNEETLLEELRDYKRMYKEEKIMTKIHSDKDEVEFKYTYVIPYKTKQTLHSWSTLREISNDAFNINEDKLFSRIDEPYEMVFKVSGLNGVTTKRVELDVFERWDTLYNRDLSDYIEKTTE